MAIRIILKEMVPEEGSAGFEVTFYDEDASTLIPSEIKWSLSNKPTTGYTSTIINSREDVDFPAVSATIVITLSGDDLALLTTETDMEFVWRVLTVKYKYTSNLGVNLWQNIEIEFPVENLYNV